MQQHQTMVKDGLPHRFHGVPASNSRYCALVTPAQRGSKTKSQMPIEDRASMTWAQRLKRVFDIGNGWCSNNRE